MLKITGSIKYLKCTIINVRLTLINFLILCRRLLPEATETALSKNYGLHWYHGLYFIVI